MDIYAANIIDHYKHPRNRRPLAAADFSRQERNAACGDELTVYIKLAGDRIDELTFTGQGCAISVAAASILSEKLTGLKYRTILDYSRSELQALLGIPISERRLGCAALALWAIQAALREGVKKSGRRVQSRR